MVKLTLDRPYTVHARSLDRTGSELTPSQYKLVLRDSITCADSMYMIATMISAKVPSTFYQIDSKNNKFTVGFNRSTFSLFAKYTDLAVVDPIAGKTTRADYERELTITIQKGNYDIESLLAEIKKKLNTACTDAHATEPFRTFMRSNTLSSDLAKDDIADSGVADDSKPHRISAPQFHYEYNKHLNKVRLYRTDPGGRMALGKFDIQTQGVKLGMALGFNHITAQQLKLLAGADPKQTTSTENSVHFRETTDTEWYDFTIPNKDSPTVTVGGTVLNTYGHAIYSQNCVNMFANDSVYIHINNLPSNAYTTLSGTSSTVMAVIPMYSGSSSENFHTPSNPTSTNIGSMTVSELDIKVTDAMGQLIDFNGVEHEFQLLFEAFENGTRSDKPDDPNYGAMNFRNAFSNIHTNASQRHAAPITRRAPKSQPTSRPKSRPKSQSTIVSQSHSIM